MPAYTRWIGLAILAFSVTASVAAEPSQVRVLTYNIHHAANDEGKLDIDRIAEVIRESGADVVALQEVDRLAERSRSVDQAAELAKLLDMEFLFGANIPLQGGEYGNAVLSRWPLKLLKNHALPCHREGEQRGVLDVEIQLPDGLALRLLATHLDHRGDESERLASAAFINELLEVPDSNLRWTLLAGDINAKPDSETLKILHKRWKVSDSKLSPTIPANSPTSKIDYVLSLKSEKRFQIIESKVIEEKSASDHRPLLVVFKRRP